MDAKEIVSNFVTGWGVELDSGSRQGLEIAIAAALQAVRVEGMRRAKEIAINAHAEMIQRAACVKLIDAEIAALERVEVK